MKKILAVLLTSFVLSSCGDDFLDKNPTIGLSSDKLNDLASMQALIYGAYSDIRPFVHQPALYGAAMMRDVLNRNRGEYDAFYDHQISTNMTSWMYTAGYTTLSSLNFVAVSDLEAMEGTDAERNSILGDMHFLRALVYFELNNYFSLPSTGYSVPLVLEPLQIESRVETATSMEVMSQIETDIESARIRFENVSGEANYLAATALAARIYFYHEKYDLAYERANEVIESGAFNVDPSVELSFVPQGNSSENIFSIKFSVSDGSGTSPSARIWEAYQFSSINGFFSLNPNGTIATLVSDENDARYTAFYTEEGSLVYVNGKYATDLMDYRYIRLPEMYLTRAESNVMSQQSVSQQDVDDINILRNRANPSSMLSSVPTIEEALNLIFEDRSRELAFELGDHFINTKRLKKGIIRIGQEGAGFKPYAEYADLLVFPFPEIEVAVHGLTRDR
jgi:hypothetical protein